jgi:hypothetical protein
VRNLFDRDYIATLSLMNVAGSGDRVLHPGAPLSACTGLRVILEARRSRPSSRSRMVRLLLSRSICGLDSA